MRKKLKNTTASKGLCVGNKSSIGNVERKLRKNRRVQRVEGIMEEMTEKRV